jgi:uncharacterized protein (TIRG00374 family)
MRWGLGSLVRSCLKWAFSILVGAVFAYLTLKDWPLAGIFHDIRFDGIFLVSASWKVNLLYLPLYFLTLVSMHLFRVWRWKPLLEPVSDVPFFVLYRVSSVGFLAMFILPFRLGEFIRPMLLSAETPVRRSPALATVFVERSFDGVFVSLCLLVALIFMPRSDKVSFEALRVATYLAIAIFAGIMLFLAFLFAFRHAIRRFLEKALPKSPFSSAFRSVLTRFLEGLQVLPDARRFSRFVLLSIGYWGSNAFGLFILSDGFGLDLPFVAGVAMMATVVVGMMIPNPPGNVGTFWFFLLKPLELYGLSGNPSCLLFALTVYSLQLLQLVLFGGYYLVKGTIPFSKAFRISIKDLQNNGSREPSAS